MSYLLFSDFVTAKLITEENPGLATFASTEML